MFQLQGRENVRMWKKWYQLENCCVKDNFCGIQANDGKTFFISSSFDRCSLTTKEEKTTVEWIDSTGNYFF